jgi:hypothetical protein
MWGTRGFCAIQWWHFSTFYEWNCKSWLTSFCNYENSYGWNDIDFMNNLFMEVKHLKYDRIWYMCLRFRSEYLSLGYLPMGGMVASLVTTQWAWTFRTDIHMMTIIILLYLISNFQGETELSVFQCQFFNNCLVSLFYVLW